MQSLPLSSSDIAPSKSKYEYPYLTRFEFELAAQAFIEQSRHAGNGEPWTWFEHEKLKGFGYLSCMTLIQRIIPKSVKESEKDTKADKCTLENFQDDNEFQLIEEIEDPSVLYQSCNSVQGENARECLMVDYHILYSSSYKVPVLYFNAYRSDGSILTLDQIYTNLIEPSRLDDLRTAGFNGGLSQQDHPTLMLPFYFLHPCETASLMKTVACLPIMVEPLDPSERTDKIAPQIPINGYLRSWLSLVGSLVGVKIGSGYFISNT
ncbi:hypothetical protein G9A89_003618 [Geosiphon pyriformis]|nr:hypothetical protein G9A89_003618 [Geosiphon pyriformis]